MLNCTKFWIAASVSFFVSMIFTLGLIAFSEGTAGVVFTVLMVTAVISGWVLWAIGLVNYLRMR